MITRNLTGDGKKFAACPIGIALPLKMPGAPRDPGAQSYKEKGFSPEAEVSAGSTNCQRQLLPTDHGTSVIARNMRTQPVPTKSAKTAVITQK